MWEGEKKNNDEKPAVRFNREGIITQKILPRPGGKERGWGERDKENIDSILQRRMQHIASFGGDRT